MKKVSITLDLIEYAYIQFVINKVTLFQIGHYSLNRRISISSRAIVNYSVISLKSKFISHVDMLVFPKKGKKISLEISQLTALFNVLIDEKIHFQVRDEDLIISRAIIRKLDGIIINYNPTIP